MTNSNINSPTVQDQKGNLKRKLKNQRLKNRTLGQIFVFIWSLTLAIATTTDLKPIQWLENQGQTLFFKIRGKIKPPDDIVIIAIDDNSLQQGTVDSQLEKSQQVAYVKGLHSWPWQREVYAQVIKKLLDSGALSVGIDLIFDSPSLYGEQDDQKLLKVLETYGDKITLAAIYEEEREIRTGDLIRIAQPHQNITSSLMSIGLINYALEADGRIHQLPEQYLKNLIKDNPDFAKTLEFMGTFPSFPSAILQASNLPVIINDHTFINFYGKSKTFEHISFIDLLDPQAWANFYQNGAYFKDKIILIGPTNVASQDFHRTPMDEKMPGIEVHANVIASLKQQTAFTKGIKSPPLRGIFTFGQIMITGLLFLWRRRWWTRLKIALIIASIWIIVSYLSFVIAYVLLPMATPVLGVLIVGIVYGIYGALQEVLNWLDLRQTFKTYASSPIVQEIIAHQDDLQDLLEEKEKEILNRKLGGRYQIFKPLSEGGFGKTYIAKDLQRPGEPECVVKQLQPMTDNPKHWELAKRMFVSEAQVLEKLGTHDQIPQLLAYFDDGQEFYLIQELIIGEPLSKELARFLDLSESRTMGILEDLLPVLDFMQRQGVIHRDIKPPNVIRRRSDDKLVLIDFGTVKELSQHITQELRLTDEQKKFTIAIGTKGYTPPEQSAGSPRYNSDIYALGMIAIQSLTLLHPSLIDKNAQTDELLWQENIEGEVDPQFIAIINKMICRDFRQRYQTAKEVLKDLREYQQKRQTSLHKNPRLTSLKQGINQEKLALSSNKVSTKMPSISDIPSAKTEIPPDHNLTDLPTQEFLNYGYFESKDSPDQKLDQETDNLTDLPTVITDQHLTINQFDVTNQQ